MEFCCLPQASDGQQLRQNLNLLASSLVGFLCRSFWSCQQVASVCLFWKTNWVQVFWTAANQRVAFTTKWIKFMYKALKFFALNRALVWVTLASLMSTEQPISWLVPVETKYWPQRWNKNTASTSSSWNKSFTVQACVVKSATMSSQRQLEGYQKVHVRWLSLKQQRKMRVPQPAGLFVSQSCPCWAFWCPLPYFTLKGASLYQVIILDMRTGALND